MLKIKDEIIIIHKDTIVKEGHTWTATGAANIRDILKHIQQSSWIEQLGNTYQENTYILSGFTATTINNSIVEFYAYGYQADVAYLGTLLLGQSLTTSPKILAKQIINEESPSGFTVHIYWRNTLICDDYTSDMFTKLWDGLTSDNVTVYAKTMELIHSGGTYSTDIITLGSSIDNNRYVVYHRTGTIGTGISLSNIGTIREIDIDGTTLVEKVVDPFDKTSDTELQIEMRHTIDIQV